MSKMMGSLTSDYMLCTEVEQGTGPDWRLCYQALPGGMGSSYAERLFPARAQMTHLAVLWHLGQEAWVHQEAGETPERPAQLELPVAEEHRELTLKGKAVCRGKAQGLPRLLSVHL